MKFGIIVFPGSNCDGDAMHVVTHVLGHDAVSLWHKETDLHDIDCAILPGGFTYGDYLRTGAMAARAPIMTAVKAFAARGGLVFGLCNGFQILVEAGLLPGALVRNRSLRFICRDLYLRTETTTPFTSLLKPGEVLKIPVAHMEGGYCIDRRSLARLTTNRQIVFRYTNDVGDLEAEANPNGSVDAIAGVTNERGNVCGMMPHPERACESTLGNRDGLKIFQSIIAAWESGVRRC